MCSIVPSVGCLCLVALAGQQILGYSVSLLPWQDSWSCSECRLHWQDCRTWNRYATEDPKVFCAGVAVAGWLELELELELARVGNPGMFCALTPPGGMAELEQVLVGSVPVHEVSGHSR